MHVKTILYNQVWQEEDIAQMQSGGESFFVKMTEYKTPTVQKVSR